MRRMEKILIIDNDPGICESLRMRFEECGHPVRTVHRGKDGLALAADLQTEVVFLDLMLPDAHGLDLLQSIKERRPDLSIIIITGDKDLSKTIQAMRWGADDFIFKPLDIHQIDVALLKIRRIKELERQAKRDQAEHTETVEAGKIIGQSPIMVELCKTIGLIAGTRYNVLIQGETSAGKELVARAIHACSLRKDKPLVAINCSALVESLLESELFGYEKGAFTGAVNRRLGKLEVAHGGTFFFDEIGDMSLNLQAKVLRVIQEKRFERLGSNVSIETDVRFISATNKDLLSMARVGAFRDDLLHRLNVITLIVPPLRERKEDIPLLADFILQKIRRELHKPVQFTGPDVVETLMQYDWPGNIRELENVLSRAAATAPEGLLTVESCRFEPQATCAAKPAATRTLSLRDVESNHIRAVLAMTDGNITRACELLEITRPTLRRKIKEYGLSIRSSKKGTGQSFG